MASRRRLADYQRHQWSGSSSIPTPSDVWGADALHWYRADLGITIGASGVSGWADQVGSANWSQGTSSLQPTHNTPGSQNGQDSVTFDGVDDRLEIAGNFGDLNGDVYMLVVCKFGGVSTASYSGALSGTASPYGPAIAAWGNETPRRWRLAWNTPTWTTVTSATNIGTAFRVHEQYRSGSSVYLDLDGANIASSVLGAHSATDNNVVLGRGYVLPNVTVEVFEVVFATNYSDAKRDSTRTYLNDRYGISI